MSTPETEDPFAPLPRHPLGFGDWRCATDCGRCNDTGRFRVTACRAGENGNHTPTTVEAHCTCKRGRRASELWYADKHGFGHPDMPDPEPPEDWGDPEGSED